MSVDLYLRAPDDPNYIPDKLSSVDDIENAVQQVRMTLLTRKGEVLGEPDFGLNTTKYLFEFEGYPLTTLEREANDQIQEYVMLSKVYDIRPTAFTLSDIADIYKTGLGISISVNGRSSFAALYED